MLELDITTFEAVESQPAVPAKAGRLLDKLAMVSNERRLAPVVVGETQLERNDYRQSFLFGWRF